MFYMKFIIFNKILYDINLFYMKCRKFDRFHKKHNTKNIRSHNFLWIRPPLFYGANVTAIHRLFSHIRDTFRNFYSMYIEI